MKNCNDLLDMSGTPCIECDLSQTVIADNPSQMPLVMNLWMDTALSKLGGNVFYQVFPIQMWEYQISEIEYPICLASTPIIHVNLL